VFSASEGETWSPGDLAECIIRTGFDGDGAHHPGPQLREIRQVTEVISPDEDPEALYLGFARYDPRPIAPKLPQDHPRADEASRADAAFIAGSSPRVSPRLPPWLRGVISMHLTNWTARRSGANMVLNGTNEQGEKVKITGVFLIKSGAAGLMAHCPKDQWHTLSTT
jgi:hypothetical protein